MVKKVTAYVKSHRLDAVSQALHRLAGISGLSATKVRGWGRVPKGVLDLTDCVKVEVVCAQSLAEAAVKAIEEAAHTGLRGDGIIYVTPLETVVRTRTGERGEAALCRGGESEGTGD